MLVFKGRMLIPLAQIRQIYHTMLNMALEKEQRGTTMYIFATNDTDSLCALKILTVSNLPGHFTIIPNSYVRAQNLPFDFFRQYCAKTRSASSPFQFSLFRTYGRK